MSKRVFLIVLDSFGIGEMPDAEKFGDKGANTIRSISASKEFSTPLLTRMGLFNIDGVNCLEGTDKPIASYARMAETSMGKDTTVGHWEIAGVSSARALPTYPHGFPEELIRRFEKLVGHKVVCNKPYSGTKVLEDYGGHHLKTGDLIVYTSADSVFQIAAHEEIVPLSELYDICSKARKMLTESVEHAVGRVIARPFIGTDKTNFKRTTNRHDYSIEPPRRTMLDYIENSGLQMIGVGKIYDIFAGKGITEKIRTIGNHHGMEVTIELAKRDFEGLAFVNLVDFDMLYGHRNNIDGYAAAATDFDSQLHELIRDLRKDDFLILTADHGCDPGYVITTDHTREYVPMIAYGTNIRQGVNLGTRKTFADIAATVCDYLGIETPDIEGKSFLANIIV